MKNIIIAATFFSTLLISTKIQAQDDANCGIYVDEKKIEKMDCWNFKEMGGVFPVSNKFMNYDIVEVIFSINRVDPKYGIIRNGTSYHANYAAFNITKQSYMEWFSGKKLAYWKILDNGSKTDELLNGIFNPANEWWSFSNCAGYVAWNEPGSYLIFTVKGYNVVGQTKKYDSYGNITYEPKYGDPVVLYQSEKFELQLSKGKKKGIKGVDPSLPCEVSGTVTKLNLSPVQYRKDLFIVESSSKNNNQSNSVQESSPVNKNQNPPSSINNTNSSPVSKSSVLKPMDKTKPGYFVEKDGAQISREGYKKAGVINGELRWYSDGKLKEVYTYANDEKNGPATSYYSNGNIEAAGNYSKGEKNGEWKRYNEDGKLVGMDVYINGEKQ